MGQDLYDLPQVNEIKLTFAQSNWSNVLDSLKQAGNDDRLIATLHLNGEQFDSVGVRFKGNSSYYSVRNSNSSKLPFNVKVNYIKKEQTFKGGYKTLKLSNVFRDPSFLREVLSYEIANRYLPSSRANFSKVYVNEEYLGVYNNTESIDKVFLRKHFGYDQGTLVKCDPSWSKKQASKCPKGDKASLMYLGEDSLCYESLYEIKSDAGWKDLISLTKVLNKKNEDLEKYLNIDQVLWMHAFNNVLVNLDSYAGRLCHNYYLFQDSFGLFQPILWDMNLSIGGFRYDGTGSSLSNEKMQKLSPFIHYKSPNRPLISQILQNALYRKVYIAHMRTILKDFFSNQAYLDRGRQIQQIIDLHVQQDTNKLYSYEAFKANLETSTTAGKSKIIGLMELMEKRAEYLESHPLIKKTPPQISEVQHRQEGDQTYITAKVDAVDRLWLAYRYQTNAPFKRVKMLDDGAHGDELSGDQIFGFSLEHQSGLEYYLIAEKSKTASLSPERAAFEFHQVK
ncbi:MAG: CotH kinase family protein [Bacteroidota bacterium]